MLLAKTNALLEAGESYRSIASLTGFDRFSVQRHKRHAFPPAEAIEENLDELQLSEKRLASLADRLESQYGAAIACGDGKLGVDILKTLSRVEAERHHRLVIRKQQELDDADSEKQLWPTPKQSDHVAAKVFAAYQDWITRWGFVICPICENKKPIDPKLILPKIKRYLESHANSTN